MRPARHGAIIPVVILALIVMAILGTWLMWQSTSNYSQMTRVAWSLRCREVLAAAMEEARAAAYDRLNRTMALRPAPGEPAREPNLVWHAELLTALRRAGATIPRGVLVSHDLKREGLLPRTTAIASANSSEITSASAELLGFKRLSVDDNGLFEDGRIYYRDTDRKLDPAGADAKFTPPMEWVGTLRLRVTVRSGTHTRTLANVLDVKVVDINASAREFVLFSYLSSARGTEHGPTSDEYLRWDLRRGGAMHLHGLSTGRIFVRGPFLVDTVGFTNGTGGPVPENPTTSNWNTEWWGWGLVPATRDGIMERAGPALVNFSMPPMRPDRTGRRRALVGLVTGRFGSAWQEWFNDDAGYYIKDGQRYFCESTDTDARIFSITGRPGAPNLFRGLLVDYVERRRDVVGTSERFVRGSTLLRPPAYDEDRRYAIEPEGGLNGVYGVVRFAGDSYGFGAYQYYRLTQLSAMQGRLGLHWERKYTTSWLEQFVTDLLRLPAVIGTVGLIPAALIPSSIAQKVAVAVLGFVGINARPNVLTELSRIRPDEIANTMPPNYRPPARSVTRRHARFSALKGQREDGVPVVLDGIVAFEELDGTRPFKYGGRGVIYSESSSAPSLVAPISPVRAGDPQASLVIHHEGPVPGAHEGRAMLNLRASRGGNNVLASIYATQGVKPQGNVNIIGTLVCGYVNKSRFPTDASLDVHYRPPITPPERPPSTTPPVIEPLTAISFRNAFVHYR
jgi:hypothetical protein